MTQVKLTETPAFIAMDAVTPQRIGTVRKQTREAIEGRRAYELKERGGELSKDFANIEALDHPDVARLFVVAGVVPAPYINAPAYSGEEFEKKSGLPAFAHTENQKGYKKLFEAAGYLYSGTRMEAVLKTTIACSIIASRFHVVMPRDVCERFLNSVPMSNVSGDLAESIENVRAKHMTGGAATQFSQCSLQLAQMRVGIIVPSGRNKDFALNLESPLLESFAMRFGMVDELNRAKEYRATIAA